MAYVFMAYTECILNYTYAILMLRNLNARYNSLDKKTHDREH